MQFQMDYIIRKKNTDFKFETKRLTYSLPLIPDFCVISSRIYIFCNKVLRQTSNQVILSYKTACFPSRAKSNE